MSILQISNRILSGKETTISDICNLVAPTHNFIFIHSKMMMWWRALLPRRLDLSVWSLHALPVYAWVLYGYPIAWNYGRWMGVSISMHVSLSSLSLCWPSLRWWTGCLFRCMVCSCPVEALKGSRHLWPWIGWRGYRKWMTEGNHKTLPDIYNAMLKVKAS